MDAFSALVSDVKPSLQDALQGRGGAVSDLALSLIQRARQYCWQNNAWDLFVTETTITLDSDLAGTLPSDYGRILRITESSNKEMPVWSENSPIEDYRYRLVVSPSVTTGINPSLQFYGNKISGSCYCRYVIQLPQVTDDAHYLLFPAELILRTARYLRAVDKGAKDATLQERAMRDVLEEYKEFYQHNDRMREFFNRDPYGSQVCNSAINLMGDID